MPIEPDNLDSSSNAKSKGGSGSGTDSGGGWMDTLRTIVYAVAIALVIRTFAYEPFNIPSGSMIPTLLVGDYLFVSKYSYGYSRHSFPFSLAPISGRVFASEPERGDVAVFKLPSDNRTDYIKRIVGLPGDRIQLRKGLLYINGTRVPRKPIAGFEVTTSFGQIRRVPQYVETLPGGKKHLIIEEQGDFGALDETREFTVPAGHFFALGDNRDNSADSRVLSQVGFVPVENLVGRAEFLFFSTDGSARFWEIWKWPFAIRYGRLFDSIE
ncbi:MAG: signal peptidase I [Rhodospirillaceae bacterium]|nr:signal peptidase I [Rhodospirillaceae bacterium]|tara:strand:+ start:108 stop:914 length:807 start_codon:yes stop_codon:yes gene_type:complete